MEYMYTGIVTHKLPVTSIEDSGELRRFTFTFPPELLEGLVVGASVSIAGVCLTAAKIENDRVSFDAMGETLQKTTLGEIKEGNCVNVLRSAKVGEENGGHDMYGHIFGRADIVDIERDEQNCVMTFGVPKEWMKFLLQKGFVGLNGCSLTVTDPDRKAGTFKVWFIPETLDKTTFGELQVGDTVNVELDQKTQTIVETVERMMSDR